VRTLSNKVPSSVASGEIGSACKLKDFTTEMTRRTRGLEQLHILMSDIFLEYLNAHSGFAQFKR
jgi:hypothetical protein